MYRRFFVLVAYVLVSVAYLGSFSVTSEAQTPSQRFVVTETTLSHKLGFTAESKTLPIWTPSPGGAANQLSVAAKRVELSIVEVGHPDQPWGTAFVISRKHRLLATNAHVADCYQKCIETNAPMLAVVNHTSHAYKIDRVWYHPGLKRVDKNGLPWRSPQPAGGEVHTKSADVAVLHVADDSGAPELPPELQWATSAELDCWSQPVMMLGYPGYHNQSWQEMPAATPDEGIVQRLTDFNLDASEKVKKQFIHFSASHNFGGFSGSPIFMANGHVVGLNNSGGTRNDRGMVVNLSFGLRVDCLWEMIAYYDDLQKLVPIPVNASDLDLARFQRPDPLEKQYHEAIKLVSNAVTDCTEGKCDDAIRKCDQAVTLTGTYALAYRVRGAAYHDRLRRSVAGAGVRTLDKQQIKDAAFAKDNYAAYMHLCPSDPKGYLHFCESLLDFKFAQSGKSQDSDAVNVLTKLLASENKKTDRAYLLHLRAQAQDGGHEYEAERDMDEAIRLDPFHPTYFAQRARYWKLHGDENHFSSDMRRSDVLTKAKRDADRAHRLLYSILEPSNPPEAVRLAMQACQATEFKCAAYLLSLSRAYEAAEDSEQALAWARKALLVAPEDERGWISARITAMVEQARVFIVPPPTEFLRMATNPNPDPNYYLYLRLALIESGRALP